MYSRSETDPVALRTEGGDSRIPGRLVEDFLLEKKEPKMPSLAGVSSWYVFPAPVAGRVVRLGSYLSRAAFSFSEAAELLFFAAIFSVTKPRARWPPIKSGWAVLT